MHLYVALLLLMLVPSPTASPRLAIPAFIRIGHVTYMIRMMKDNPFKCLPFMKATDIGCTIPDQAVIEIASGMALEPEKSVVFHELVHAMAQEGGNWSVTGGSEVWAQALENPTVALLEDNPTLVQYFLQRP